MVDPTTTNVLLSVPTRGSDAGTWDTPVNGNATALDGYIGGVQTVSVSGSSFTLTAPTGSPTPAAGPTQSQNRVLKFTGTLTTDIVVTLPLPGSYLIDNQALGTFFNKLTLRGATTATEVVVPPPGEVVEIYNDGNNVRFIGLSRLSAIEIWAGLSAMPLWVTGCTLPPYLLCDGSLHNFSDYPFLAARFGSTFGGNGITTFGVPDLRGRMALPYDGTGTRITSAGCGINGQTLGASQDKQTNTLITGNLPPYTPSGSVATTPSVSGYPVTSNTTGPLGYGGTAFGGALGSSLQTYSSIFTGTAQGGVSTPVNNVQPAQVTGIAVVRAA